jgi:prevent-host-death family protein
MKKIAAGYFKKHLLEIINDVQAKREAVMITKHGKPVAKSVPLNIEIDGIYNFFAGKEAIAGDILSPHAT